jgi:hypothetical protein
MRQKYHESRVFPYPESRRKRQEFAVISEVNRGEFMRRRRGLASLGRWGRLGLLFIGESSPMTNRVSYAPQDFQKMCKQAERDHESKKLVVLIDRVKRQIAERENPDLKVETSRSAAQAEKDCSVMRLPSRSVPFER